MKDYVERYIYAVTKRLKEESREEVKEELSAHINDMLPKDPSEEDVERVLKSLGSPRKLAYNYQDDKNYVISPLYYHDYINTLKIVLIILVTVQVVFGAIDGLINLESNNFFEQVFEIIGSALGNVWSGLFTGFAWVTIIFWILDYIKRKEPDNWSIKDLPDLPHPKTTKISRVETIIELMFHVVFSTIFIGLLINYLDVLAIDVEGVFITEIFNRSVVEPFIPYFIGSAIFGLLVYINKLYVGEWRYQVSILHTAYELLSSSLIIIFLTRNNLIKQEVFTTIETYTDFTSEQAMNGFHIGVNVITWVIIIIILIDLITMWIKTLRGYKKA
jgi:hypothetical protein